MPLILEQSLPSLARRHLRGVSIFTLEILLVLILSLLATARAWPSGRAFLPAVNVVQSSRDSLTQESLAGAIWTRYAVGQMQAGEIPLWDPHVQMGLPLVGIGKSAVFFPTFIVQWLFSPRWSWLLAAVLKFALAGFGMMALLRCPCMRRENFEENHRDDVGHLNVTDHFIFTPAGRFIAIGSYMLSGLLIGAPQSAMADVAAMMPWVFVAVELLLAHTTPFRLAIASFLISIALLGGDPAGMMAMLGAAILWTIIRVSVERGMRRRRMTMALRSLAVIAALFIALSLAGIQTFPLAEYLVNVKRVSASAGTTWGAMPIFSLVDISWHAAWAVALLPLILAAIAVIYLRDRQIIRESISAAMMLLGIVVAIIALKKFAGSALAMTLGGPGLLCPLAVMLALLGGRGVDVLARIPSRIHLLAIGLSVAGSLLLIVGNIGHVSLPLVTQLGAQILMASAIFWVLVLRPKLPEIARFSTANYAAAMVLMELALLGLWNGQASLIETNPRVSSAAAHLSALPDVARISASPGVFSPPLSTQYDLADARGGPVLPLAIFESAIDHSDAAPTALELADIRYWIHPIDSYPPAAVWQSTKLGDSTLAVYSLENAPAPVWMADSARPQNSSDLFGQFESSHQTIWVDPRLDNFFDADPIPRGLPNVGKWYDVRIDPRRMDSARLIFNSPRRIEIGLQGRGGGWLVISQRFYPGWSAKAYLENINYARPEVHPIGLPTATAMGCLPAILVPPRVERVVFEYDPMSWRWGTFASAAGAITLALLAGMQLLGPHVEQSRYE